MGRARQLLSPHALLLLGLLPLALAQHSHGAAQEAEGSQQASHHGHGAPTPEDERLYSMPSYWSHTEHAATMYAHIGLMVVAWATVLPIAVMLSIARSRLSLPFQWAFLLVNGLGVFFGFVYNHQTPDLYVTNAHHKNGWAANIIAVVWAAVAVVKHYADRSRVDSTMYQPVTTEAMEEHQHTSQPFRSHHFNWSRDSGQGTERNTASLQPSRTNSLNSDGDQPPLHKPYRDDESDDDAEDLEKRDFLRDSALDRLLSRFAPRVSSGRPLKLLTILYIILERGIIPLGFITAATGVIAYGGIARAIHVFNVLAHFIKGGIFFWYGLLTFGRWMGCFADFGWAWNIKPGKEVVGGRAKVPNAEFTESFVIWFYGASNVFLEHLAAWGKPWTAMDLEHISITILFFGGGLLGMLVESPRVRRLLNSSVSAPPSGLTGYRPEWQLPDSSIHALNPLPGLVILLLGLMMSSHTQHSAVSSAIHKQWGTLFVGFAMARAVTYITFWLKPPSSYMPQRPPSEIVAGFCLISGGAIFMASNADTVHALEAYDLDAMFVFTVTMGITALLMAWQMVLIAMKNWASQRTHTNAPLMTHPSPA